MTLYKHDISFIDPAFTARGLYVKCDTVMEFQKLRKTFLDNQNIKRKLNNYITQLKKLYEDDDINDGIIEDLEDILGYDN